MRVSITTASLVLTLGLSGCRVSKPGAIETRVLSALKHHVTVGNKSQRNPLPDTAETWNDGKDAFSHYCVACHGLDGSAAGVPFAQHISPPIPSLGSADVQAYSDGQLKWILDNGVQPSGMPASRGILSDDELWSIVVFLRHLPPEGGQVLDMYNH